MAKPKELSGFDGNQALQDAYEARRKAAETSDWASKQSKQKTLVSDDEAQSWQEQAPQSEVGATRITPPSPSNPVPQDNSGTAALQGGVAGATAGSAAGPYGAAIGAVSGAVLSYVMAEQDRRAKIAQYNADAQNNQRAKLLNTMQSTAENEARAGKNVQDVVQRFSLV